jgi:hypothetical protein
MAAHSHDEKMIAQKFSVEVTGKGEISNVISFDAGRVTIDNVESTQGDEPEHRVFCYGKVHYDDCQVTWQQGGASDAPIAEWVKAVTEQGGGGSMRADVTCFIYKRNGKDIARTVTCKDCLPIDLESGDQDIGGDAKTMVLTLKVGYVEVS